MSISESIFSTTFLEISRYLSKKKVSHYFFPTKFFVIHIVLDILFIIVHLQSFVDKAVVGASVTAVLVDFTLFLVFFALVTDSLVTDSLDDSLDDVSMLFDNLVVNSLSLLTKSIH